MTEEEYFRENYPDSCYGDRPLSPHWDFFQDGVEFGERQSEKQIQIGAEQIRALQKQNGELTDKLTKAKEIIKTFLGFAEAFGYSPSMDKFITEAEQFISEVKK